MDEELLEILTVPKSMLPVVRPPSSEEYARYDRISFLRPIDSDRRGNAMISRQHYSAKPALMKEWLKIRMEQAV